MRIIIVGAGKVGYYIAERLSHEQHNVVVIDSNEEKLKTLGDGLDLLTIQGNGALPNILEDAGIKGANLFLAVTDANEVNMIACQMAKFFGVERKVARISDPHFFNPEKGLTPETMGIDWIIEPARVCAEEIARLLSSQEISEDQEFADGKIVLAALPAVEAGPLAGKRLYQLKDEQPIGLVRLVAIARSGETIIPRGNTLVLEGDDLYFMCNRESLPDLIEWLGLDSKPLTRVVIAGAGEVGIALSSMLEKKNMEVHLLEQDHFRAEFISGELNSTHVYVGDATDLKALINAGIGGADAFISVTGKDEDNILSCLLAKQQGVAKTVAVLQKPEYLPMVSDLNGVDVAVSPRLSTASAILKFIRRGVIHSVVSLRDVNAEVWEVEITKESKVVGKELHKIKFPEGAIIGAIVRGEEPFAATGDAVITEGDHLIIFSLPSALPAVESLLAQKKRFGFI